MKKIFCVFSVFVFISPVFAEVVPNTQVATTSYVQGAYNTIDSSKQNTLTSSNVVTVSSGTGAMVTGVSAENGTVTVTKSDVTIPVGGADSSTRARIWIQ